MRKTGWQLAVLLSASLGFATTAVAQATGSGSGSVGTGAGSGVSSGPTSSPGVTSQNGSETGVGVPGNAPVDSRTLKPAQQGTASTEPAHGTSGTGSGPSPYTDLLAGPELRLVQREHQQVRPRRARSSGWGSTMGTGSGRAQ